MVSLLGALQNPEKHFPIFMFVIIWQSNLREKTKYPAFLHLGFSNKHSVARYNNTKQYKGKDESFNLDWQMFFVCNSR